MNSPTEENTAGEFFLKKVAEKFGMFTKRCYLCKVKQIIILDQETNEK